jgi:hypothetical protein
MRKSTVLTNLLLAGMLLGAVVNVAVFVRYLQVLQVAQRLGGQTQRLQAQVAAINRNFIAARSLAAEAVQFAQKNPDFERLLRSHAPLLQRMELLTVRPSQPTRPAP